MLEFTSPVSVVDYQAWRELLNTSGTILWEMVHERNGSVQKTSTPIGEYAMPFSFRARKAPMIGRQRYISDARINTTPGLVVWRCGRLHQEKAPHPVAASPNAP